MPVIPKIGVDVVYGCTLDLDHDHDGSSMSTHGVACRGSRGGSPGNLVSQDFLLHEYSGVTPWMHVCTSHANAKPPVGGLDIKMEAPQQGRMSYGARGRLNSLFSGAASMEGRSLLFPA